MKNTYRTQIRKYKTYKAYRKAFDNIPRYWDEVKTEKTEFGWNIVLKKY